MMLLAAAFINVANALDASGDPPFPTPVATCVPNVTYIVVSRPGHGPGNEIFARPASGRSAESCALRQSAEGFRVAKAGESKSVLALQGKFLILDEGAGPSIRRLLVVELAEGGEVWSGRYAPEPKPSLSARGLIFYKYLRIAGKKRLPQGAEDHFTGVNAAVCDQWSAFLPVLALRATGQPDCIAGQ